MCQCWRCRHRTLDSIYWFLYRRSYFWKRHFICRFKGHIIPGRWSWKTWCQRCGYIPRSNSMASAKIDLSVSVSGVASGPATVALTVTDANGASATTTGTVDIPAESTTPSVSVSVTSVS